MLVGILRVFFGMMKGFECVCVCGFYGEVYYVIFFVGMINIYFESLIIFVVFIFYCKLGMVGLRIWVGL